MGTDVHLSVLPSVEHFRTSAGVNPTAYEGYGRNLKRLQSYQDKYTSRKIDIGRCGVDLMEDLSIGDGYFRKVHEP